MPRFLKRQEVLDNGLLTVYYPYMNRTQPMYYKDPRTTVVPEHRLGPRVARHKDHPLMQATLDDAARKDLAVALDFQAQLQAEAEELAKEAQTEATAAAKRGLFGKLAYKVFDTGIVFFFGQVPDAIDDALSWLIEKSEASKKNKR